jgi:hypothetical protein
VGRSLPITSASDEHVGLPAVLAGDGVGRPDDCDRCAARARAQGQIQALDQTIAALVGRSEMARRIDTIPGFGSTCSGELAGEIGALERFAREARLLEQ